MKRFIVLIALAAMVAISLPATAWAWGSAHPDSSDDYINRRYKTFRGHELLLHDALLMLKAKRLIPASLGETYLQSMYYSPFYISNATTSQGYKYLIKGVRLADYDITVPYTGWNIPWISSAEHYYDPLMPFLSDPIIGFLAGGFNAKTAFMVYINGGTITAGIPGNPSEIGAIQRFKNGDITGGFQALGYAIHYLQDMSMPYHATPYHALTTVHGPVDGRGDTLIYNERLQFEKDALERWLPNNDLSFANDAITNKSMRGNINSIMRSLNYNHSQNLDDFIHAAAKEAANTIQYIDPYWFPPGSGTTNWTQIENQIRPLLKRNEERIAQLIFYVFWKAGMYPTSLTTNRDFAHPNTAFLRVWVPTNYKVTGIIDAIGAGGFGTVLLNRCWANDNLTIKSGAGSGKRSTITLVGRDGRKISENTGPYGGEAVLNTSNGSNTGWYTLYVTSPDITSGTGNVYVNVYNNQAKDVLNNDPLGKEPPVMKPVVSSGGGKTGKPPIGAPKGENPSAVEIGYDVGRFWYSAGNGYRYYINNYSYDTDLFWTDMSYNYIGNPVWSNPKNNAVLAVSCLRFDNFYYDHSIYWKWYRPDGVLYYQSGSVSIVGMNTTGFTWNFWDVCEGTYLKWDGNDYWMQNYQGVWRQEIYIDNNLYTTQYFGVNTPPTITNVANGAYINGGPVELGTSVKGVPNYVDIRLDGTSESNRVSLDYAAPYSGVVNASILADGAHTAYAYVPSGTPHTAGTRWTSALSFTVDKTKPTATMSSPATGSTYAAGSAITVSANASDTYGVSKVVFYANSQEIATDNASPYSCTYTMPNPAIVVDINAVAYDRAGNTMKSNKVQVGPPTVRYEADQVPDYATPAWVTNSWGGWWTSGGILTVESYTTAADWKWFSRAWAASSAVGTTMEAKMKLDGAAYPYCVGFESYDGTNVVQVRFRTDTVQITGSTVRKFALNSMVYRTYRLTLQSGTYKLYVDGAMINQGTAATSTSNMVRFGAFTNKASKSYWDYVYYYMQGDMFLPIGVKSDVATSIEETLPIPVTYNLLPCAPNPFSRHANIRYQMASPGHVSLMIYNISGQLVKLLVNEPQSAGYHSIKWDGRDERGSIVAAGVYLYRMQSGDYSKTNKMTVLK